MLLLGTVFCLYEKNINIIKIAIIDILILLGLFHVYKYFIEKSEKIPKKYDNIIVAGCLIIHLLINIIFNIKLVNNYSIFYINLLIYTVTVYCIYLFCRRVSNKSYGFFSLIISFFIFPFAFHIFFNDIRFIGILIPLFMVYIMEGFDYNSILRKKNIFRLLILFILSLISIVLNKICLISLVPILIYFFKKNIEFKKYYVCITFILLLLVSFLIINNNILIYNISNYYYNFDCNLLFIYMTIALLFTILFRWYNVKSNFKLIFILFAYYIMMLFIKDTIIFISMISLITAYIANNLPLTRIYHFNFIKYRKPNLKCIKKVSAVIPNYNYENYIESRIDSVLNQNYPIYELIILDDKSSDNSIEVIENKIIKVKEKYPDLIVKFIPNKVNSGNVFKQWAKCFEVSSGDYLWICEADDLCSKYFLNSVMKGFEKDNKVVLSYSESKAIDENNKTFKNNLRDWIDIYGTGRWNNDYTCTGKEELKSVLCINNTIANVSGVVFKKTDSIPFADYLKTSQKFILAGDWYFYTKVLLHGNIHYCSDSFNYHRIHSGSVTSTTDNFIHYKEVRYIQDSICNDIKIGKASKLKIKHRDETLKNNFCISDEELYYDNIDLNELIKKRKIKDEILLSVIIPVYNVEKYINKCLKSIFMDLPIKTEVIIINDGSPDNSEDIINSYIKNHSEIKYVKKENGGLSSVKNLGLKIAKGKYIIYLDSDDYVSSDMYNTMLKMAIDKDADIIHSDVLMTYENGNVRYCNMINYENDDELMRIVNGPLMAASWNKMIKKELYNGLEFPEKLNNEDVAVTPILLLRANKIFHILSPFYKYVQRSGSIQNSGFNEKRFVIFDTAKICFNRIKEYDIVTREKIQGAIVTHQILSLLLFPISEISDKILCIDFIEKFCVRYNELDLLDNNKYIFEYLNNHKKIKLIDYIKNDEYESIYNLIKEN